MLVWCVVTMIVVVLLGAAASAMAWDPRGSRRSAAAPPVPAPATSESTAVNPSDWPRTQDTRRPARTMETTSRAR